MTLTNYIMEYLKNNFNFDYSNSFTRNTFENFIDFIINEYDYSKNQLAYKISDLIDELTFDEVKEIIEKYEKEA